MPIISRFVADFLGLKLSSKTTTNQKSEISENEFYKIITDYQHFLNHNDDETSVWKRRGAFLESMERLVTMFDDGQFQNAGNGGLVGSIYNWWHGTKGDWDEVLFDIGAPVRHMGLTVRDELAGKLKSKLQVQTAMFLIALEGAYNTVLMVSPVWSLDLSLTKLTVDYSSPRL